VRVPRRYRNTSPTLRYHPHRYEFIAYDTGVITEGPYVPKHKMPSNWQEYQGLQARVASLAGETTGADIYLVFIYVFTSLYIDLRMDI